MTENNNNETDSSIAEDKVNRLVKSYSRKDLEKIFSENIFDTQKSPQSFKIKKELANVLVSKLDGDKIDKLIISKENLNRDYLVEKLIEFFKNDYKFRNINIKSNIFLLIYFLVNIIIAFVLNELILGIVLVIFTFIDFIFTLGNISEYDDESAEELIEQAKDINIFIKNMKRIQKASNIIEFNQ